MKIALLLPQIFALAMASFLLGTPTQGLCQDSEAEIIRLISIYGPDVEETLESLPQVQKHMRGNRSSLTAAEIMLATQQPAAQKAFLTHFEEVLQNRRFIEKEARGLPNGVYQLAMAMPHSKKVADDALNEAGMPPASRGAAYDATSNMSTYQHSHMVTCLALMITNAKGPEKEKLKNQIKQEAAKLR